jgi:hypothetical protein
MSSDILAGNILWRLGLDDANLKRQTAIVENTVKTMTSRVSSMFAGVSAAVIGGAGLTYTMKWLVQSAMEAQDAQLRLSNALWRVGDVSGVTLGRLSSFSTEIQNLTTYGDEAVQGMMAMGVNMGITTDKIERATKAAIGLSRAYGLDMQMAMRSIAMSEFQNPYMLRRAGISLPSGLSGQQRQEYLTKLGEGAFSLETRQTQESLSAGLTQMKNVVGEVAEALGTGFLPALQDLTHWLKEGAIEAQGWASTVGTSIQQTLQGVTGLGAPKSAEGAEYEDFVQSMIRQKREQGGSVGPLESHVAKFLDGVITSVRGSIAYLQGKRGPEEFAGESLYLGSTAAEVRRKQEQIRLEREQAAERKRAAEERQRQMRQEEAWRTQDKRESFSRSIEGLGLKPIEAIGAELDPWAAKMRSMEDDFRKQMIRIKELRKQASRDDTLEMLYGGMLDKLPAIFKKRHEMELAEARRARQQEIDDFTKGEEAKSVIALTKQRDRLLKADPSQASLLNETFRRELGWMASSFAIASERMTRPVSNFAPAAEFGSAEAYKLMHPDLRGEELDLKEQQIKIEKNTFEMAQLLKTLSEQGLTIKGLSVVKM